MPRRAVASRSQALGCTSHVHYIGRQAGRVGQPAPHCSAPLWMEAQITLAQILHCGIELHSILRIISATCKHEDIEMFLCSVGAACLVRGLTAKPCYAPLSPPPPSRLAMPRASQMPAQTSNPHFRTSSEQPGLAGHSALQRRGRQRTTVSASPPKQLIGDEYWSALPTMYVPKANTHAQTQSATTSTNSASGSGALLAHSQYKYTG